MRGAQHVLAGISCISYFLCQILSYCFNKTEYIKKLLNECKPYEEFTNILKDSSNEFLGEPILINYMDNILNVLKEEESSALTDPLLNVSSNNIIHIKEEENDKHASWSQSHINNYDRTKIIKSNNLNYMRNGLLYKV